MRAPLEELHAFALSYRSLSAEAVTDLEQAAFADSEAARAAMAARLGGAVEEVGIVQKCNAVVVVVVAAARHNPRFIRQRTLDCWDQLANGTILPILPKVRCYSGLDAAQFLVECAVGLHSLVVGDSQVLHQMTAIAPPGSDRRSTVLGRLAQAMKQLAQEVREQTGLNDGELSAERLACARVTAHVAGDAGRILVVGAGRSADLVTKILAQEERRDVVVVNRSPDGARSVAERRGATHEQIDAAPALAGVSAVVLAVPRDDESVGFAGQLLTGLTDRHPGALVADLSPRPLVAYDRFRVVPLTLATIAREAREHSAARQGSVSQAHELIRKRLPQLAEDVDPRARSMATAALRPLPSEKRQLIGERAGILAALRELLARRGFDEIITPCVVDMPSDPPRVGDEGAFALDWLGRGRFLRQSNQVYKQMAVAAGAERVYEIGPVWRRESALSPRHLYESTGLDAEWRLDDGLDEVLALAFEVVVAAAAVTPTDVRLPAAGEVPAISYAQAVDELQGDNVEITYGDDLGHEGISQLASIVARRHGSDCFAVTHFPDVLRRFYTQSLPDGLTATFDLVVGGWKVASGAVRELDTVAIARKMQLSGLAPEQYEFYLHALESAPPHGGFGLGLDRLAARLLGSQSVVDVTLF